MNSLNNKSVKLKKKKKNVTLGVLHIQATFNNTIVNFADTQGNTIVQRSAGMCGFKGSRKATPAVARVIVDSASKEVKEHGLKTISIRISGPGSQRESALRAAFGHGFIVKEIMEVSPLPHNGCRPPSKRRN